MLIPTVVELSQEEGWLPYATCANAPLCGGNDDVLDIGRCSRCNACYQCNFAFSDAAEDGEACPICLERQGPFMTYGCGHRICAACFTGVMCQLPSGPPPRTEEFNMPARDEEDNDILDEFEVMFSEAYVRWESAYNAYYEQLYRLNETKRTLMARCPVCRHEGNPLS